MDKIRTYNWRPCSPGAKAGFTLVELMVASLILSIIITAVYYTYRSAMDSYRATQARLEVSQNAQVSLEVLGLDLRGAFQTMNADRGKLDFVTSSNFTRPPERDYGLVQVKYYVDKGLRRAEIEPVSTELIIQPEARIIAPWVTEVHFSYSDGDQWFDSWDSSILKKMPAAVKVLLKVDNQDAKSPVQESYSTIIPVFSGMKY